MNIKKIIRTALIGLASFLVIAGLGLFLWSATSTYPAREVALESLETSDAVTVSQYKWIVFTPEQETDTGLIFYPGGLVEPAAYAPVLRRISHKGILVVITPMPLNLAILNTGAASGVIAAYPEISTWVLAGHSLGGASAGIYAEKHTDRIDALALWDSYPPDSADLSDTDLAVLSIYGTTDKFPNTDNFDDKRGLLPGNTVFVPIEGASHAQFGDYGPQKGDVDPTISLEEQHDRVAEFMVTFINEIE